MNVFASGWKKSYYGKGDVIVYRLNRDGGESAGENPVFGVSVQLLIYGEAFWPTYTEGDNTGLVATDSMKNFIQRETMNFSGYDLESYARFLTDKFLSTYPQAEGAQVAVSRIPYDRLNAADPAFAPSGPERARVELEQVRNGPLYIRSGIAGFRLLRLSGSAFTGFVRDEYTTLPEIHNRPLHMWLDLEWHWVAPEAAFTGGSVTRQIRGIVRDTFAAFESGSIQQIIYQMGTAILAEIPAISQVDLEANNRTWDTVVEESDRMGVYTDARPPFGCLGLSLKR